MQQTYQESINYISQRFNIYFEEIKIHPLVDILFVDEDVMDFDEEDIQDLKDGIKQLSNFTISEDYQTMFCFANLSTYWGVFIESNNLQVLGGFELRSITELFMNWQPYWRFEKDEIPEERQKFLKNTEYFQRQHFSDDGKFGIIYKDINQWPPPIYFYDNGEVFPMDLSIIEYVEAMLDSYTVENWQYFYVRPDSLNPDTPKIQEIISRMEIVAKVLPELFPEKDFSYHQQRLEEVKKKVEIS